MLALACISEASFKGSVDWLQSLKQFFINVPYHILVASLKSFKTESS